MRVATYTQASPRTRGSLFALAILIATIFLGTGVLPEIAKYFGGPLPSLVTPIWLLLYASAFLGLMLKHGINWLSWVVRYRILLVLLMLGTIMSVSWSIDAQVSAERTVHLVGSTLVAIYIGFTVPLLTTLRVFAVVLAIAILSSVVASVGMPSLGIENYEGSQVWKGVFNSKNDLGFWAAVGVILYITLSDSLQSTYLKIACFLMAGICLATLALSQSATSLLAMLVAGALSLYLFIASRFELSFIKMVVLACLFGGVVAFAILNIDTAELVGRTDDLTGRGEVWRQTWKLIMERPLTGVGYGSLWFPTDATLWIQQSLTDFTWIVYHAHNGLLQVASEVGLPLAMIALLMVAQQLIEIFYCQYERQQVGVLFVLAFAIAYLISNFSEARFLVTRELFWIFFLALPISMLRQINLMPATATADNNDPPVDAQVSYEKASAAYQVVPGKPWLGPTPRQLTAVQGRGPGRSTVSKAAVAAIGTTSLVHQSSEKQESVSTSTQMIFGDEVFDDVEQADVATDSKDEELELMDSLIATSYSGEELGLDLSVDEENILEVGDEQVFEFFPQEPLPESIDGPHATLSYDDSLEIDKYDLELDSTGEWIDIPLEEDSFDPRS